MLPRILIVALCCCLLSCKNFVERYKRSSSGVSELDKKLLYDGRTVPVNLGGVPANAGPPGCTAPLSSVQGSFTYAAEQEVATLYQCKDTNKLIVYSGGKVQASADTPYTRIAAVFDLNQDDKNELLLTGGTERNGERAREASLVTFEKGSVRAVEDFGIVYHDSCILFAGANATRKNELIAKGLSPYVEALSISYLPRPGHEMPSFTAQRMRAPCPADPNAAPSGWEVVSPK